MILPTSYEQKPMIM